MYAEYFETFKNVLSGGKYLLVLTLKCVVTLLGLVIISYTAISDGCV